MDKVFSVYAAAENSNHERCTTLSLPATDYELLDVLSKTNVQDFSGFYVEIEECGHFPSLSSVMGNNLNLCELNALAERLSVLDKMESTAFKGMLDMEIEKGTFPIPVSRLVDLAYSTDRCHVLPEVKDDAALGRFYAENGFVMEAEEIPDRLFEMLDFGKIGREMRQSDGGVYTHGGYVMRHSELAEVYKGLDLTPREPDYAVALRLTNDDKSVTLKLPAGLRAMSSAVADLNIQYWQDAEISCLDCMVPLLTGIISSYDGTLTELNDFAQKLADMDNTSLPAYKALLDAAQCNSISDAECLADTLDQYIFSEKIASPEELARSELTLMLSPQGAERLIPHVNLYNYGQELLEHFGAVLTDYGMIERRDGQPVQSVTEQPQHGGMEMM